MVIATSKRQNIALRITAVLLFLAFILASIQINRFLQSRAEKNFNDDISVSVRKALMDFSYSNECVAMAAYDIRSFWQKYTIATRDSSAGVLPPLYLELSESAQKALISDYLKTTVDRKWKQRSLFEITKKYWEFLSSQEIISQAKDHLAPWQVNQINLNRRVSRKTEKHMRESFKKSPLLSKEDISYIGKSLQTRLQGFGINTPFVWYIYSQPNHDVLCSSDTTFNIFSHDITKDFAYYYYLSNDEFSFPAIFLISFPEKEAFLDRQTRKDKNWTILISSVCILLLGYTVYLARRNRKNEEMHNNFISNLTHEFKTPISVLTLAADILRDPSVQKDPELREEYLRVIPTECKRLRHLVEEVLKNTRTTDRLQKSDERIIKKDVDLIDCLFLAINDVKTLLESRNGTINTDECVAENTIVQGNTDDFVNVFSNILENAIKYSTSDPVIKISIDNDRKGKVIVRISDNGIGIKKSDYKKIFDRYYRVSTGYIHDVKGYGIGLNQAQSIIKEHGGKIKVESIINQGSTFIIVLPITK